MRETLIVVLACPGRELTTFQTIAALEHNGGGHKLPERAKWLFWNGPTPPPSTPPTWGVEWGRRDDGGPDRFARARADVWRMFRWAGDCDLIYLEDDILPCRNALPYMFAWASPLVTSFHNMRNLPVGPWKIDASGWCGTQAVKIPAPLLARFQAPDAERTKSPRFAQDMVMSKRMSEWGELLHVHRSIVQHVGEMSLLMPGATLAGARKPARDFPGVEADAFQLT